MASCGTENIPKNDPQVLFDRDLAQIQKSGKLRALTAYSSTSYFLYRGQAMGFEYELLQRFADFLDVELEIVVSDNIDSMFSALNKGTVDVIAHGLTITRERKAKVAFTDYLFLTRQVLVQKKPDNWRTMQWIDLQNALVQDAMDLLGDTVSVRRNSAYYQRLVNLSEELGGQIFIDTLPGTLSTDRIIQMVVDGDIGYTIADQNIASINASYYPVLDIEVPISFSQRIAWAVRPNAPELLHAANAWITKMKKKVDYYVIYNKYFKNEKNFRKRVESEFYSLTNNAISQYDPLIRKYAQQIGWDWRLLAAQIYQESRFDPEAESWAGARGLMQMMPAIASALDVDNRTDPEASIRGGVQYLQQLWGEFDAVTDTIQRQKFTLASYNCGLYHVLDAQRLAEEKGFEKEKWDNNVAEVLLDLSYPENYTHPVVRYGYVRGIEPYTYVEQIFERLQLYKRFISA
jgi:membrane-bound lytic murein transglycosylase F